MEPGEFDRTIDQPTYQVRHTLYDISDGLNGIPTRGRAVRSTDGRLWFLTGRGITVLDPHALTANRASTPIRIEEVIANDRHYRPGSTVVLPPGSARLEIDYSTLDLRTSLKTRYRYRLDDFDRDWLDAGTRRQAFYTNLPPRTYRFRVMASNSDGIWTDAATTFDFEIQPMFYQTMGFYALCVTAVVSAVCLAWRLHVRRVRQQFALLLRERVRLSNELHDTLVQGLVGVGLQCDAIATTLNSSSEVARSQLSRARALIDRYIREAHYAIHDLRSPALETSDVAEALRQAGERVLAGAPVRFDFDVVGTPVRGAPKVEEQIVRIGEEAILNAARHARPSNVSLKLVYSADALHLGVSDDGCGFDLPRQDRLSDDVHCGIRSMQERTELVGGSFRIDSAIGRGTRLEVVIPRARYVG
jgi:signal transduction histidine kinase